VLVLSIGVLSAIVVLLVNRGPTGRTPSALPGTVRSHATTTTTTTTTVPPTTTTTTDPGTLPQTSDVPNANSAQFQSEMAALWQGVVTGTEQPALPAFFPESAYLQMKTFQDPRGDYTGRLLYDYGADLAAAHGLLGAHASTATLSQVLVPTQYEHWIPTGTCNNRDGYFEVAHSRVVYQEDGQTRSFGIASMISWRGEWYVVHLGTVLRSSDQGVVDDPETGPGTSVDSFIC